MKALKVILVVFAALVILVTAGVLVFLKTFNVNSYLPQITQQVSKAVGRDLKVGGAELGVSLANGIRLEVKDISLADDPRFSDKPFFAVSRIEIGVNPGALFFERKVQMTGIVIDSPRIVMIRAKDGTINVQTMGAQVPAKGPDNQAAAIPALLVNDIKIVNGSFTYIDQGSTPALALTLARIDVHVSDLSLVSPFQVSLKASLFSAQQNVTLDARVDPDLLKQAVRIKDLNIGVDLALIDAAKLEDQLPMLKPLALKKTAGLFKIDVPEAEAGAKGLATLKTQASLEKGLLLVGLVPVPAENITLNADISEKQVSIKTLTATVADGVIRGNALIVDYLSLPVVTGSVSTEGVNINKIAVAFSSPLGAKGILSGDGNVRFSGSTPEAIVSSLSGETKADIKDAVIENMNFLSASLGKIPMLPGLLDSIMPDLSQATQDDIRQGSTHFQTVHAQGHLVKGGFQLDAADATTQDLAVHAQGAFDFVSGFDIKVDVRLTPDLSGRLALRVKALAGLKDEEGRIYIPLNVKGPVAKPKVIPDIEYLAKKMIVAQGGEQLQQILGSPDASQAVNAIFDLFKKK